MPTERFTSWEDAVRWLREQPDRQYLVHAAYYDDPLINAAQRYWRSEEWAAIRSRLGSPRGRALDVGAGRGIASYALALEGFAEVVALEPDPSALVGAEAIRRLAADAGLPIRVTQEFSERLPYDDESFDLVFARAVLHHTSDLGMVCRELHRVLRSGGRLVAVREHVVSSMDDLQAFLDIHPLHNLYGGENAHVLQRYQLALRKAGFRDLATLGPWDSPINFAPHTPESLHEELATRVTQRIPLVSTILKALIPPLWGLLRPLLNAVDRRPGRLYSFIATKA